MPEGNDFREIPKEIWHNKKLVDEWIEKAKERHKHKNDTGGLVQYPDESDR